MTTENQSNSHRSTEFRKLRRVERALDENASIDIIKHTDHAVLSTADATGVPYGVPITPVLVGNALYFHSTGEMGGRKADNMLMNSKVSVCFIGKAHTLPEVYSVDFASVIVSGKASEVTDNQEKILAMKELLKRHAPNNSKERNMIQAKIRYPLISVWKVKIESICGKARAAKIWTGPECLKTVQQIELQSWLKGAPK
ncbi:MAG: pyridoxamine 5'-phosphate oxidase family protein [Burkholderiaceae bacterium]|nr:pyridoxamine 5'-phosphate oxidase family protein [Burkholderiaceae bacterium]